ncbi:hypothetical protein [Devosia riboflavina]|uniref:hypothetical protein n=1 Tax=Devosia riboflavina TaxID=46914 RepID=UPI00126A1C10|nr:hypothetical protein [Devosia riboflavina]
MAKLFSAVASPAPYFPPTHSMAVLTAAIIVHQRRLDTAWNAARSSAPGVVADRSAWTELRPYEAMIAVMHGWLDALWTRFVGEVA